MTAAANDGKRAFADGRLGGHLYRKEKTPTGIEDILTEALGGSMEIGADLYDCLKRGVRLFLGSQALRRANRYQCK